MYCIRKNVVKILSLLLFGLIFYISGFEVSASYYSCINGTSVNVRATPSSSAKIVTKLSNTNVIVTATQGDWSKVSYGKYTGWVKNHFLKTSTTSQKTISSDKYATIKGSNVNIRSSNSTNSKAIAKVSNKQVQLLSSTGDWYKVSVDGKQGWVKKEFVTLSTSTSRQLQAGTTASASGSSDSGLIKGNNINLRSKPTTTAKVIGKLSNKTVKILSKSGAWYKVSYNGLTGWVSADFVSTSAASASTQNTNNTLSGLISKSNVNVRATPSSSAKIVTKLTNEKVSILSSSGNWYKISYGKTIGWVSKDLVSVSKSSSSTTKQTTLRNRLILCSRGYLGTRYVYGGSTPKGFDCSGFTSYVYKKCGIKINRTATQQAAQGKYVSKSNLQPGDLVFFDTDGSGGKSISHVGIYIGNSNFIHASSGKSKRKVTISSLNESFYAKAYVTGRTFIK